MDNAEHTQRLTFCFSYPAHNRVSHTSNERIVQHCWKNIQLEYSKCSNGLKKINQISSFFFLFLLKLSNLSMTWVMCLCQILRLKPKSSSCTIQLEIQQRSIGWMDKLLLAIYQLQRTTPIDNIVIFIIMPICKLNK